jgi:hypothetical protein
MGDGRESKTRYIIMETTDCTDFIPPFFLEVKKLPI